MEAEKLTVELQDVEIRQLENGRPVIAGYAVVFDSWSQVMLDNRGKPFRERFASGAFDRTLSGAPDVRALWNHNPDLPLGRTRNNTLRLQLDGQGLRFELEPPANNWGADAVESIRRGDVSGMSFAFNIKNNGRDTWEKPGADGIAHRTVIDADLYEVSPVTFPAYPATSVVVCSLSVPDFETETETDGQAADEIGEAARGRAAALLIRQLDLAEIEV